jgi:hypothetical protein
VNRFSHVFKVLEQIEHHFQNIFIIVKGNVVVWWLRHCATNWKVTGMIPDGVTGFFHLHNPSSHTMALGSTQPLTEMSIMRAPGFPNATGIQRQISFITTSPQAHLFLSFKFCLECRKLPQEKLYRFVFEF